MDQNSTLKKEAGIAERKLLARNERIQNLEALLQDADRRLSIQNQKFETQLQAVKERLDQARGKFFFFLYSKNVGIQIWREILLAQKAVTSTPLNFGRIAKPLRGGGGGVSTQPLPSTGGGSVNPITRLQNDDAGYVVIAFLFVEIFTAISLTCITQIMWVIYS